MRAKITMLNLAVAAALTPTAVSATRYTFDLTGSRSAQFTLESTKPSLYNDYQTQFRNVRGTFGGAPGLATTVSFGAVFFISALDVSGTPLGFTQFSGPELFTGPTSDPVFTVGTFSLTGIVSGNSTITIATAAPVVEPGGFMLLAGASSAVGYATWRRRTKWRTADRTGL